MSAGDSSRASATPSFEEVNGPAFLARLRAGDAGSRLAFAQLVRATHGRLLAYVRRHLGALEDAQEVVQEVFLGVHKGLAGFEGKSKLTTWMFGLAHFKVCDVIAERRRVRSLFRTDNGRPDGSSAEGAPKAGVPEAFAAPDGATDWDSPPDAVLARRRLEDLMAHAVASLKPPGCDVYRLRDVEGLSGEEVAGVLGISHAAVRVQLHRARMEIVAKVRAQLNRAAAGTGGRS